jgi:hypothetical protein
MNNPKKNNYIFFLGGYDAEMVTIKDILKEKNLSFFDNNLKWGAKLSEYKKELSELSSDQIPVFIELNLDIDYPEKTIIIDHHGDKAGKDKKTSIEQVAELLNIELNRKQKLISANDKDYIWGMMDLGATEEEIKHIRKRDREAQGVTEDDEINAELSIQHYLKRLSKNVVLIYSLTEKTSPIIDRIYKYYIHIFIISPSDILTYSGTGKGVELLKDYYDELKKDKPDIDYWFGGNLPIRGYFGSKHKLTEKEVIRVMKHIMENERIHSQHIFMFPFEIESKEIDEITSSTERLKKIYNQFKNSIWKYKPFEIRRSPDSKNYSSEEIWAYNEYYYYYDYVRETLFNKSEEKDLFNQRDYSPVSLNFELETNPNDEMVIFLKTKEFTKIFSLVINHLSLRIFETGIGILTITLYNYCYTDFEDILIINDFGRRIYPQFLSEPDNSSDPIDKTKNAFLADKIVFKINEKTIEENFNSEKYLNIKANFVKYIEELLSPLHEKGKAPNWRIIPIIDDRMFTICWHENEGLIKKLSTNYENDICWYKYIYVDGKDALIANKEMMKKLIKKSTYSRFSDWGTLFGISRYSFMCLCGHDPINDFPYKIIRNHMQKIYYQMFVLLLAQRASIIKFNNSLEKISTNLLQIKYFNYDKVDTKDSIDGSSEFNNLVKNVKKFETMNLQIINFFNRMIFLEVTPQEQGIELYNKALKFMQIPKHISLLKQKVSELHLTTDQILERHNLELEHKRNEYARMRKEFFEKITLITLIFLPLSIYKNLSEYIKPLIKTPSFIISTPIEGIYTKIWSITFLMFLIVLFYCLINDNYNIKKKYPGENWFYPLRALYQQFFYLKSERKLYSWKIFLDILLMTLILLSFDTILHFFNSIVNLFNF